MMNTTDYATHGTPDERLELRHLIAQTVRMNDPRLDPPAYGIVRDVRDAELVEVEWTSGSWAGQVTAWTACELVPLGIGARPDEDELGTITTESEAVTYLSRDGGRVPCSRYGWDSRSCAPWAWAAALIVARETEGGDPTTEDLEHMMGRVVNDHDDPASLIAEHGAEHGIAPELIDDAQHLRGCERCGGELDRDCFGEDRCEACDGPCPGCFDGPGPEDELEGVAR